MMFSILIPTNNRADTLYHAIRSVLAQSFPEFELVVMDNATTDNTPEIVRSFHDPRIKHIRNDKHLQMSDNWEAGLAHTSGDYVFVLGDDDAMLPDGLDICRALIIKHQPEIVSWVRYFYTWPNASIGHVRNRLHLHFSQQMEFWNGKDILRKFYQSKLSFEVMPMIYNSFVSRKLIERVSAFHNRYFCSSIPDVGSGIANAYFAEGYIFSNRSLSLSGSSGHSLGATATLGVERTAVSKFLTEIGSLSIPPELYAEPEEEMNSTLTPEFGNAVLMFQMKEKLFADDSSITVDLPALISSIANGLGADPSRYSGRRAYVLNLAKRYGLNIQLPESIPARSFRHEPHGPRYDTEGRMTHLAINCQTAGITNAADAARLAYSILPPLLG